MFESIKDMYLKRFVKEKTKIFYEEHNMSLDGVNRMSLDQINKKMDCVTYEFEQEVRNLNNKLNIKDRVINGLEDEIKVIKENNITLQEKYNSSRIKNNGLVNLLQDSKEENEEMAIQFDKVSKDNDFLQFKKIDEVKTHDVIKNLAEMKKQIKAADHEFGLMR